MSTFKTHMVWRTTPHAPITVDANPADYDERFTYLGQLLRKDDLCSRDAASEYSNAKSVLLQGSECWWVFEREKMEMEKIRSFHDGRLC